MKKVYLFIAVFLLVYGFNRWLPSVKTFYLWISPTNNNVANVDFHAYYMAGEAYNKQINPYQYSEATMAFNYPPTFVPLYAILARLNYTTARAIWLIFYCALFVIAAWLYLRWIPKSDRIPALLLLAGLVLYSYPLAYHIRQGQMDMVSSSLAFIALMLYLMKHPNLSAVFLAAATLVKLNPVFLLATFVLFTGDWKYLLRYAAALLAMILISFLFFKPDYYRMYLLQVLPTQTKSMDSNYNQTPLRFFAGDRWIPRIITITLSGLLSVFAYWLGKKFSPKQPEHLFLVFLLNVIIMLFVSGKAWVMAYTWFLIPSVPVIFYLSRHRSRLLFGLTTVALLMMQSVPYDDPVLNTINMAGAAACAILIVILLIRDYREKNLLPGMVTEPV
jgi:hypothetical protein